MCIHVHLLIIDVIMIDFLLGRHKFEVVGFERSRRHKSLSFWPKCCFFVVLFEFYNVKPSQIP